MILLDRFLPCDERSNLRPLFKPGLPSVCMLNISTWKSFYLKPNFLQADWLTWGNQSLHRIYGNPWLCSTTAPALFYVVPSCFPRAWNGFFAWRESRPRLQRPIFPLRLPRPTHPFSAHARGAVAAATQKRAQKSSSSSRANEQTDLPNTYSAWMSERRIQPKMELKESPTGSRTPPPALPTVVTTTSGSISSRASTPEPSSPPSSSTNLNLLSRQPSASPRPSPRPSLVPKASLTVPGSDPNPGEIPNLHVRRCSARLLSLNVREALKQLRQKEHKARVTAVVQRNADFYRR